MAPKPLQLGRPTKIPASPAEAVLDRVANPHPGTDYVARFTFPEFTSLCPVTGQPDFAIVVIDYLPRRFLIESKSLKLYLNSFRNHAVFHEDCTVTIGKRLVALLKPRWLRIGGYFHPRGGMPIDVFWQAGRLPRTVWVPDQGVRAYRGREWRPLPCPHPDTITALRFSPPGRTPSAGAAVPPAPSTEPCWVRPKARGRDPRGSR